MVSNAREIWSNTAFTARIIKGDHGPASIKLISENPIYHNLDAAVTEAEATGKEKNLEKTDAPVNGDSPATQRAGIEPPTPAAAKQAIGPTLNTSMLEAKLSSVRKSTDATPSTLSSISQALKQPASSPQVKGTPTPHQVNSLQAIKVARVNTAGQNQGLSVKGAAKQVVGNATKVSENVAAARPMSALRTAALASLKPGHVTNGNGPETKLIAKRGESPAPNTADNQGQVKPTAAAKQAGSPNLNNKPAAPNKVAAKTPAGTGDGLDNIKILTFEEIMAQKRAKKEAEQAAAAAETPKMRSPRTPITATVSPKSKPNSPQLGSKPSTTNTAAVASPKPNSPQLPNSNPAVELKDTITASKPAVGQGSYNTSQNSPAVVKTTPASIANSVSDQKEMPALSSEAITAKQPATTNTPTTTVNSPANRNSLVGIKRPLEPTEQTMPVAKKIASEELKLSAPRQVVATSTTTKSSPSAAVTTTPVAVPEEKNLKRPLETERSASSNKKRAIEIKEAKLDGDDNDELAQFEAEFGDLEDLEGGDIKDFDEETLMKELEELEDI
jgi:hypothetical protein